MSASGSNAVHKSLSYIKRQWGLLTGAWKLVVSTRQFHCRWNVMEDFSESSSVQSDAIWGVGGPALPVNCFSPLWSLKWLFVAKATLKTRLIDWLIDWLTWKSSFRWLVLQPVYLAVSEQWRFVILDTQIDLPYLLTPPISKYTCWQATVCYIWERAVRNVTFL